LFKALLLFWASCSSNLGKCNASGFVWTTGMLDDIGFCKFEGYHQELDGFKHIVNLERKSHLIHDKKVNYFEI